jgi:hypothetical protein
MFGKQFTRYFCLILFFTGSFLAFAEPNSAPQRPIRILFLGNSFTFMPDETNTHPVTPFLTKAVLQSKNIPAEIDWVTAGAHTLQNHFNEGIFEKKHLNAHEYGYYTYVILQPYSIEALELPPCFSKLGPDGPEAKDGPEGREMFLKYAKILIDMVRAHGAIPIVVEPWIYEKHHAWLQADFECLKFPGTEETWYGGSLEKYQNMLDEGYTTLHAQTGVELLRIGRFWKLIRENPNQVLPLKAMYLSDHYHPSELGALLSAYLISERVSKLPADHFSFLPDGVNPAQAKYLAKVAMQYFTTTAYAQ